VLRPPQEREPVLDPPLPREEIAPSQLPPRKILLKKHLLPDLLGKPVPNPHQQKKYLRVQNPLQGEEEERLK
jgi:hypothetical protein